jgi:hypothetical protein
MSIFGSIMSKIFNAAESAAGKLGYPTSTSPPTEAPPSAAAPASATPTAPVQPEASPPQAASQPVDVEAVLSEMASKKGGGGNWQASIVDLLKLLDLDSSLGARKELANELNVHTGADGSAEENIALHKAVMQKLAENGGKVPESMKG